MAEFAGTKMKKGGSKTAPKVFILILSLAQTGAGLLLGQHVDLFQVLAQGLQGEAVPVEVVANHEVAGEAGAGVVLLVPAALGGLGAQEILHAVPDFRGLGLAG